MRLIQLFDPPFDKSQLNPGYIKGYVPGVRENGGQYTHARHLDRHGVCCLGRPQAGLGTLRDDQSGEPCANRRRQIGTYKVEPYVVAADVYAVSPHTGRGGWTWYTGSAGWMYRLIIESLLGLKLEGDTLRFVPCLPPDWKTFKVHYRYRETMYHITVLQSAAGSTGMTVTVDGIQRADQAILLADDRHEHSVEVTLPTASR